MIVSEDVPRSLRNRCEFDAGGLREDGIAILHLAAEILAEIGEEIGECVGANLTIFALRIVFGVCFKLARVAITSESWNVWRRNLLANQHLPVHFGKPSVSEDLNAASMSVTVSLRQVGGEAVRDKIPRQWVHLGGIADVPFDDLAIQL